MRVYVCVTGLITIFVWEGCVLEINKVPSYSSVRALKPLRGKKYILMYKYKCCVHPTSKVLLSPDVQGIVVLLID